MRYTEPVMQPLNTSPYPRLFITGIPTAGKSYLARKLAVEIGGISVSLDHLRQGLCEDPDVPQEIKDYIQVYWNKSAIEEEFLTQTPPEELWNVLVEQSKALWPFFKKYIEL